METRATYGTKSDIRATCLQPAGKDWSPPAGEEIKAAMSMAGWSGVEFARRMSVDDRTARRWIGEEKPIPYAAWCVLCMEAGLGKIWK